MCQYTILKIASKCDESDVLRVLDLGQQVDRISGTQILENARLGLNPLASTPRNLSLEFNRKLYNIQLFLTLK